MIAFFSNWILGLFLMIISIYSAIALYYERRARHELLIGICVLILREAGSNGYTIRGLCDYINSEIRPGYYIHEREVFIVLSDAFFRGLVLFENKLFFTPFHEAKEVLAEMNFVNSKIGEPGYE